MDTVKHELDERHGLAGPRRSDPVASFLGPEWVETEPGIFERLPELAGPAADGR